MHDIILDDFEEKEYNLTEIGLPGLLLVIEKDRKYLAGPHIYMELIPENIVVLEDGGAKVKDNDDMFGDIVLNPDQYKVIQEILKENSNDST